MVGDDVLRWLVMYRQIRLTKTDECIKLSLLIEPDQVFLAKSLFLLVLAIRQRVY